MTNNIQCSIESSTTKIELNSAVEGVFLVPELEGLAGLPEIRTTSGVNAGYDGGWTSAQNYDARLISIRGVIANPDVSQVEAKRRAIASLLGQGRKEQLTLRLTTEAGNSYAISVRTISCEMALQRVLTTQEFLIQLRADDPLIYDDGASAGTEAILHVQRALGGFEIDFELPLAIGGGAESTIVENGEEMVYPIIKLYGPLHSPTVVNTTTNQQMQLNADLQYTVNWSGYENEEGSVIAISDGIESAPMSLTQLDGNATQTTYSGKNLFDISKVITNGTSVVNNGNGTLTITTPSASSSVAATAPNKLSDYCPTLQAGDTATFSMTTTGTNKYIYLYGTGANVLWGDSNPKVITQDMLNAQILWYASGVSTTATISDIQIELGNAATAYEPYVGGTASPNPDYPQAIEVVTGGQTVEIISPKKNIANPQTFKDWISQTFNLCVQYAWGNDTTRPEYGEFYGRNNVVKYNGASLYTSRNSMSNPTYVEAIKIFDGIFEPNKQYTISFDMYSTSSGGYSNMNFVNTDGTVKQVLVGTQNQWTHITTTSTSGKSVASIGMSYQGGSETYIDLDTLQIEEGASASSYEPFVSQEYEVNLGKNLFNINRTLGEPNSASFDMSNKRIFDYGQYVNGLSMNNYYSSNNSTCSISDGVLTVSSIQTGYGTGFAVKAKPNTNYVVSFTKSTTSTDDVRATFYQADGTYISYTGPCVQSRACFKTPSNCDFFVLIFRPTQGVTMTVSDIQIEEGLVATDYTPFMRTSRNLFDISKVVTNGTDVVNNGNGTLTIVGYGKGGTAPNKLKDYCPTLQEGDTVTLSATTTSTNKFIYLAQGSNESWNFGSSRTITATDLNSLVLWYAYSGNQNPATISDIQVELGTQATFYEPYYAQLELAKIDTYQDYIWNDDGIWKIHREIGKAIYDGDAGEAWTAGAYGTNPFYISLSDRALPDNTTPTMNMSNLFRGVPYGERTTGGNNIIYNDISFGLYVRNTSFASLADFQTALSTTPLVSYYVLATPFDTEITDDTLLAQLNTISELYGGMNNISIVPSAGAQGTIEIQYATEYTIDQDVAVIDSQARTITINGQDAYHLKTDESEFLLLAPGENKLYLTSATDTDEGYAEVKFKQGYLSI